MTRHDSPEYPKRLLILAIILKRRFDCFKDASDIDHAVETFEKTLNMLPSDHPERASHLVIEASCRWCRFELTSNVTDKERAVVALEAAVEVSTGPSVRIHGALLLSCYLSDNPRRASRSLKAAARLLPTSNPRNLSRKDQ